MRIQNGKMFIPKWEGEIEIELTSDERLAIKLGYVCFYDYESKKVVLQFPEGVNFEEEKEKYFTIQAGRIKEKYQNLIFEKYSLTDQLNMSNEAVQIIAYTQSEKRDFTEEESLKLQEIKKAKDFIDEQRKNCQSEIENL